MSNTLLKFVVSGCLATLMDALVYSLLFSYFGSSISKACGFLAGSSTAFVLGRVFTFQSRGKVLNQIKRFGLVYACTLCANVVVHEILYNVNPDSGWIPFLGATAVSTVLNYLGQKYFVFKEVICS